MTVWSKLQEVPDGASADVVVVGAGAVGMLLAVDLARAGKRVLLLEAGQPGTDAPNYTFNEVASSGRRHGGLDRGRFRALGGTTTQWGGQLVPMDSIVFERRDWLGETGWPIGAADLAEAYDATFERLGMGGRLADEEVWRRLRVAPPPTGGDLDIFLTRWAPEPNFARLFAADIEHNKCLVAVTGATVTGLFLRDDGGVGLSVEDGSGGSTQITADHVVLASGTIEIARLLLLPLEGGGSAPWARSRWLGRGFADHVDVFAGSVRPIDPKRFHDVFDAAVLGRLKYLPKLKLSEDCQRREQLLGIAAHFVSASASAAQLAAFKAMARSILNWTPLDGDGLDYRRSGKVVHLAIKTASRFLLHRRIYNPADQGIQLRLTSEQLLVPESGLTLSEQRDALGMPMAKLDWRVDGAELRTLARFAAAVAQYLREAGLAEVALDPMLVAEDAAFLDQIDDGYHHMGMARMAATPDDGVVDANLKVFGTGNLYVAGAAVFRSTGFANPTLTAMALGMRLSRSIQNGSLTV